MRYKNTETFEDGMGRKYSVSGPCMCGALDCEECRPGNNYEKREQEARGETYCMQCEDHQLSEFADETLCEKCGKPFGFVWGIFPKDQGFHRIQWAIPEDTADKALRLFFREVGIIYTQDSESSEDSYDACAEGFWVLPMEGHPDWTEWNECTPPEDYLPLVIGKIPWAVPTPGGDSPK